MSFDRREIAILIENNHNDHEVWYPVYRFREAGVKVTIVGPEVAAYKSKLGQTIKADIAARDAVGQLYSALLIPGGYAPDLMRLCQPMIDMIVHHFTNNRVVAAICHGSWLLASADVIRDKRVTGAPSIRDDLVNAGARFEDIEVVRDGMLITSRKPDDLPAFCREIIAAMT